jgi:hypothetical protein
MNFPTPNRELFFSLIRKELSENIMNVSDAEISELLDLSLDDQWIAVKAIMAAMMGVPDEDFEFTIEEIHKESLEVTQPYKVLRTEEEDE